MFFCRFAFFILFFFFLPPNFLSRRSTDLHQIWQECVSLLWAEKDEGDFWKVKKPGHNGQKTSKKRSILHTRRHVFVRCDETVKDYWKIFIAMTPRVLYLSKNVIVIVQNRPVFSNTLLNGASKKTDFDGYYLENGMSYGQS